jgi:hypothetical protein
MKSAKLKVRSSRSRKLWTGIGILALLSPLGLILPKLFGAGGAGGEWRVDEIKDIAGYVPEGLKRLSTLWSAPVADYAFEGWDRGFKAYVAYILSGILGVAIVAAVAYILGKILKRGER